MKSMGRRCSKAGKTHTAESNERVVIVEMKSPKLVIAARVGHIFGWVGTNDELTTDFWDSARIASAC